MNDSSTPEIVLGEKFGNVVVKVNGARVEVHSDGSVDAYTDGTVKVHPARDVTPKPGDWMEDGTKYVGVSPDTGRPMYTTPADVPLTMHWKAAMDYAAKLNAHGHKDWRVPTRAELSVLYKNRNEGRLKGTFNGTDGNSAGMNSAGCYWSSAKNTRYGAWTQCFRDGNQDGVYRTLGLSLRLVRG